MDSPFSERSYFFLKLQLKKTLPVHIKRFSFFALLGKKIKFIGKSHTSAKIYSNKIQYELQLVDFLFHTFLYRYIVSVDSPFHLISSLYRYNNFISLLIEHGCHNDISSRNFFHPGEQYITSLFI